MKRISLTEKLSYFDLDEGHGLLCYEKGPKNLGPIVFEVKTREDFRNGLEVIKAIES